MAQFQIEDTNRNSVDPRAHELIRVLIIDGDPRVSRAFVRLLEPADDIDVIATAADPKTAIELAVRLGPAVAVVDVGTAGMDGMGITRMLRQQAPATRVVMLGIYASFCSQALAAGACRFLLKDCGREELVAAIGLAARGQCQENGDG